MEVAIINPHVLKICIAARAEDSINAIAHRIHLSYGWTHKWVRVLAEKGVFKITRMKVYLNEKNEFYRTTMKYIRQVLCKNVQFFYEALSFSGITYCFTQTDAVFIWTKGGYTIGRYRDFYPIFIKIKEEQKSIFENYCKKMHLPIHAKKGIFYEPVYVQDFEVEYQQHIPVESLQHTIQFMKKYIYNFEPALEMIKEMYHQKINVKYKEVITNV